MKSSRLAKKNNMSSPIWYQLLELLVAAMLMIQCRSIWVHLTAYCTLVNRLVFLILSCSLIILSITDVNGRFALRFEKNSIKNCIIFALYAAVFVLINPVNYTSVIRCAIIVCLMLLLSYSINSREKLRRILLFYRDILLVIAIISVICWVFLSIFHVIDYPWSGDVYVNWSDSGESTRRSHFLYLYYETQWFIVGSVARNTAVFVEGPMASFNFFVALLIELFVDDGKNLICHRARISALLLAIITNFTATGYVGLFLLAICLLVSKIIKSRDKGGNHIFALIAACAFTLVALMLWKLQSLSGTIRFDDILACISAWKDKPLFGGGWESQNYINKYISMWRLNNLGSSNSPFVILANGGIYLAAIYLFAFIKALVIGIKRKDEKQILFLILFAYLFTITIVPYQYITFFMLIVLAQGSIPYNSRSISKAIAADMDCEATLE